MLSRRQASHRSYKAPPVSQARACILKLVQSITGQDTRQITCAAPSRQIFDLREQVSFLTYPGVPWSGPPPPDRSKSLKDTTSIARHSSPDCCFVFASESNSICYHLDRNKTAPPGRLTVSGSGQPMYRLLQISCTPVGQPGARVGLRSLSRKS